MAWGQFSAGGTAASDLTLERGRDTDVGTGASPEFRILACAGLSRSPTGRWIATASSPNSVRNSIGDLRPFGRPACVSGRKPSLPHKVGSRCAARPGRRSDASAPSPATAFCWATRKPVRRQAALHLILGRSVDCSCNRRRRPEIDRQHRCPYVRLGTTSVIGAVEGKHFGKRYTERGAIRTKVSSEGGVCPVSIFEIWESVTPAACPSWAWVRPRCFRNSRTTWPNRTLIARSKA